MGGKLGESNRSGPQAHLCGPTSRSQSIVRGARSRKTEIGAPAKLRKPRRRNFFDGA
jgi:hypothetical protein